ncbi:unnamed protein product [Symbiodinium microadriaticum]|nr:unnamed protein product [Symbiodinium microadriaticum]
MEALLAAYRAQVDVRPEGKARGLSDSDGSERAVAKSTSSPRSDSDDRRGEKRKKKAKKDSDFSKAVLPVKDTDLYDEIHFDSAEDTLTDVLIQFFETQSSKEEFDNWNVKALMQGKCVEISAPTTPATLCKEVVLIRKGG